MNGRKQKALEASGFKASCLEKMFVQKGERRPRLRLAGFGGDWIKVQLKDCFATCNIKPYIASAGTFGRFPVVQQGDNPIAGYFDDIAIKPFYGYEDVVVLGDHTLSLYKPQSPFFVATDGIRILKAVSLDGYFLYSLLNRYKPTPNGYKRYLSILGESQGFIPPTAAEQRAIGKFFEDLDKMVELQEKKVEKLRHIKAGCLERMFG